MSIDGTNSPVTEGETVTVDVTVENTGGKSDEQTIKLNVDGQINPVATEEVTLDGGESTPITLEWETEEGDGGNGRSSETYNVTVKSDDDSASTSVDVRGSVDGGPDG